MDPKIEELAKDPVMGRAFRELGRPLAEHATGQAPPANGNEDDSGPPTSGMRARNITQDRPSELIPSYELPGRLSGEALAWHRQASDLAAGITQGNGPANDAADRTIAEMPPPAQSQIHPAAAHMHPELGKVITAVYEHQMEVVNTQPGDPIPAFQYAPVREDQSVKSNRHGSSGFLARVRQDQGDGRAGLERGPRGSGRLSSGGDRTISPNRCKHAKVVVGDSPESVGLVKKAIRKKCEFLGL